MTKHQKILNFISLIRNSHSKMTDIFTQGSCGDFYKILREVYPESIPYYNSNHMITRIDDKYYDITGQIFNINNEYLPFGMFFSKDRTGRKLNQLSGVFNEFELNPKIN